MSCITDIIMARMSSLSMARISSRRSSLGMVIDSGMSTGSVKGSGSEALQRLRNVNLVSESKII